MASMNTRFAPLCAAFFAVAAGPLHAAAPGSPQTFSTPQEAAQALVAASEHNDTAALVKLFGPGGKDFVDTGDAAIDKDRRVEFARRAHQKMVIDQDPSNPDYATIVVGSNDWPFPVPLVRKDGQWSFNSSKGRMEILARRVGRDELSAMEVCRGYVEAQLNYAAHDRAADGVLQYAQKIVSTAGKKDGLYWEGESETLVPKAFADAATALTPNAAGKAKPYHGYYFRILTAQGPDADGGAFSYLVKGKMIGGFGLVAWPAEYGVSGVHTFIVNHKGVVYEKDLGPTTAAVARQMTAFNPSKGWKAAEKE